MSVGTALRGLSGCRRPVAQLPASDELQMPARFPGRRARRRVLARDRRGDAPRGDDASALASRSELFADALADYRRERDDLADRPSQRLVSEFSDGKGGRPPSADLEPHQARQSTDAEGSCIQFGNDFGLSPLTVSRLLDAFQAREEAADTLRTS